MPARSGERLPRTRRPTHMRRRYGRDWPPPQIVGVPERIVRENLRAGLPRMQQMEERVMRAARRSLA
jgi:hypothetical protein